VQQIARWRNKGRSHTRILLKKLNDASLIVTDDYTSYELPMYKKKHDEGIRPSDIHLLTKKLEELEAFVRDSLANGEMAIPKEIIILSREKIISMFYKGIGQERISAMKREKARKVYKKLRTDDFTPEEIAFAVQWTLDNANEKPYDFALIPSTIGQALAVKVKAERRETAEEERQKEADSEQEKLERQEKERDDWEFYKAELPEEEREELKQRAIQEIGDSEEFPAEFISDVLIVIKENDILRREGKGL
jgi:hypothetical protein